MSVGTKNTTSTSHRTRSGARPAPAIVKRSRAGLGLYADADISRGKFVIEYKGPILTEEEADRKGGKYLFEINKDKTIDGTTRKNTARYLNHSCRPNCEVYIEGDRVMIYARRGIKAGEELTYNYGREYFNEFIKPHGCRCPKCLNKPHRS